MDRDLDDFGKQLLQASYSKTPMAPIEEFANWKSWPSVTRNVVYIYVLYSYGYECKSLRSGTSPLKRGKS